MAEEMTVSPLSKVYEDTTYFIDSIVSDYPAVSGILGMMRDGNATIELKKRYLLRAIDEQWVNIIEDTLPALDVIIRNPRKFIEEREEIVPIEFARNTSARSVQHLSQHTNMISSFENGEVTPSKILNVFREETMMTYENKFINTLINRLYAFVNRRYEIAKKAGQDEKTTSIDFKENFEHGNVKVRLNFRVEIAESADDPDDKVERNYTFTSDLWRRVEKLNSIITMYAESEFCQNMGKAYIRPPVQRTNAILKNREFRQCLALWQFIEGYDEAGYSMLIQENLESVDDAYIKELYSTLALQYLIFRYNIHNEFDTDATLVSEITDNVLKPRIIDQLKNASNAEFDVPTDERAVQQQPSRQRYFNLTPEDELMLASLDVALDAASIIRKDQEAQRIAAKRAAEQAEAQEQAEEEPEKPETETSEPKDEGSEEEPLPPMPEPAVLVLSEFIREAVESAKKANAEDTVDQAELDSIGLSV